MSLCYAESVDGLHWEKPHLGLCTFEGSARNNILLRGPHGPGVFRDDYETDPACRYKLLFVREEDHMMSTACSADGLRWSSPTLCPEMAAVGDTHNNALWVPELGRYVGFTRLWSQGVYAGVRVVGRSESPDFRHWTPAQPVLQGLDDTHQVYAMPVFRYGEGFCGLAMIFNTEEDRVHSELAWSADTLHWERVAPGMPLIPNGAAGEWDWGCVYAAAYPVVHDGVMLLYYGGSDNVHTNWRHSGMGLARLHPDRLAGYRAVAGERGVVITNPLHCPGGCLRLNLEASHGGVEVAVLNETGSLVAESTICHGDEVALPVHWRVGSLDALAGHAVQLRFRLTEATLYSFSWGTPD
jgi:hypothetical protein